MRKNMDLLGVAAVWAGVACGAVDINKNKSMRLQQHLLRSAPATFWPVLNLGFGPCALRGPMIMWNTICEHL